MNHLEQRNVGMLLRPGYLVTTQGGQQYEVYSEARGGCVMCAKKDERSGELQIYEIPLDKIVVDEDQITSEDRQRVAQQVIVRRREFLQNLPKKLQRYTYENVTVHEGNRNAVERCKSLDYGTNLFIFGSVGNGKTMLAVATAHNFAPYYSVAVWGVVDLFTTIRASFNSYNNTERPDLKRPEILVLDDIGKSKASDFVYEELYNLVNYRWEQGKTTIFTSNHGALVAAQKVSPDQDNAHALLSRMASGDVIEVTGRDQRVLQGKKDVAIQSR